MSAAYYIVLEKEDIDFCTFVNGKALARDADRINRAMKSAGLPRLDDFISFGGEEMEAMAEDFKVDDMPDWYTGEHWFKANEGIQWIGSIRKLIQSKVDVVRELDAVLADLQEYENVLKQAAAIGAKWHLSIDY